VPRIRRTNLTHIDIYYLFSGLEWTGHHYHHCTLAAWLCNSERPGASDKETFLKDNLWLTYSLPTAVLQLVADKRGNCVVMNVKKVSRFSSIQLLVHSLKRGCEQPYHISYVTHATGKLF
jgi:hypothetical protein